MKIAKGFSLRNIGGNNVVVPVGEKNIIFKGMITLNGSGAFLWKQLQTDITKDDLIKAMLREYEIDKATAKIDIDKFIYILSSARILE